MERKRLRVVAHRRLAYLGGQRPVLGKSTRRAALRTDTDRLLEGDHRRSGRAFAAANRAGRSRAGLRRTPWLAAIAARSACSASRVAGTRVLENQLPASQDLTQYAPGPVFQRRDLHVVRRRGAALRNHRGHQWVRPAVRRSWPARSAWTLATRVRSLSAALQVPMQLPDLFGSL